MVKASAGGALSAALTRGWQPLATRRDSEAQRQQAGMGAPPLEDLHRRCWTCRGMCLQTYVQPARVAALQGTVLGGCRRPAVRCRPPRFWSCLPSSCHLQTVVIDCRGHMLGRLASIIAKQLLSGQHIVSSLA